MLRTSVILFASFGMLAGCATSSANSPDATPPDAGNVNYDVGQSAGGGSAPADSDDGAAGPAVKGRDSTTTRGAKVGPKVVKRIPTSKPPKTDEPEPAPGAKPKRVGRVDPHGLLAEVFEISTATEQVPDFADLSLQSLFIAKGVDSSASTPLAGLPNGTVAPVALRFTGSLNVLSAGEYLLCTTSMDGSQFYVEDTLVVDNDGLKTEAAQSCELVSLDAGEYTVEVRSFHVTGPVVVQLAWAEGKEGTPTAIPLRSLYKPADADARVKAGQ